MYYRVEHHTRYTYSEPITESVVEAFMQPRTDELQRCLHFKLMTAPEARSHTHTDFLSNAIHTFDIPGQHTQLSIRTEAVVEIFSPPELPDALPAEAWGALDAWADSGDFWDFLTPSPRTQPTPMLLKLAEDLGISRRDDPLTVMREASSAIYHAFDYAPDSTKVDSPIDDALVHRAGVCQDFSHILIALARHIGIPARYVSGYLFYRKENADRSTPDATHAWIEVLLPELGWIGFDPTNNILAGERHIRTAVGRDYNDVPPTRGVFKGAAQSQLEVEVVTQQIARAVVESLLPQAGWTPAYEEPITPMTPLSLMQMQQQQ